MTAPSPQTTIAGLRDKVANLRRQHTRALRERDDARDEVVALCAQRLELDAKHAEEIRRHTETAEAAKRGWAKASTEVERLTAERDEARAALDRVRKLADELIAACVAIGVDPADIGDFYDHPTAIRAVAARRFLAAIDGSGT